MYSLYIHNDILEFTSSKTDVGSGLELVFDSFKLLFTRDLVID